MIDANSPPARIASLDFIRGIAVMGILVANLPAFALPNAAYFSPRAWGGTAPADITAWFATFVLVEGKMRGLFSFLFGASTLLVIERAEATGDDPARVHFARMASLFAIGLAHLYLLWWGDILAHYAIVGAIAFLFVRLRTAWLIAVSIALLLVDWLSGLGMTAAVFDAAARDTPARIETWRLFADSFGTPPPAHLAAEIAAMRGNWADGVAWRAHDALGPLAELQVVGPQTLSAMLLGMAGYRTGFITGRWPRRVYVGIAATCIPIAWLGYTLLAHATLAHGFDQRWVVLGSMGSAPLRSLGFIGYAAALMLLVRPDGRRSRRVMAVGRAAFTNYLGTSLMLGLVFYGWGLGQYGEWTRAQLYLLVPPAWAMMLAWSAAWLGRYRFGPAEWVWRSLARLTVEPMRRTADD